MKHGALSRLKTNSHTYPQSHTKIHVYREGGVHYREPFLFLHEYSCCTFLFIRKPLHESWLRKLQQRLLGKEGWIPPCRRLLASHLRNARMQHHQDM